MDGCCSAKYGGGVWDMTPRFVLLLIETAQTTCDVAQRTKLIETTCYT